MPGSIFTTEKLLERLSGDRTLLDEIAGIFIAEYPSLIAALSDSLMRRDLSAVARDAHTLKGLIAYFTDGAAHRLALDLEQTAKRGNLDLANDLYGGLVDHVELLKAELRDLLNSAQEQPSSL